MKMVPPGRGGLFSASPYGSEFFTLRNVPLATMVEFAFGVLPYQISGKQKLGTEEYDVTAKPWGGKGLTYKQLAPLVQQLLRERFDLKYHYETKTGQGYVLTIAKGGPKLHPAKAVSARSFTAFFPKGLLGKNITTRSLASALAYPLGCPVVDNTGLKGHYDVELDYA